MARAASSTRAGRTATVSVAENHAMTRPSPKDVECCCCLATSTVICISVVTFLFGGAICLIGMFLNNTTRGWELDSVDLVGWLCVGIGGFTVCISLLGICAARSSAFTFLFLYFVLLLTLVAAIALAVVYVVFENERFVAYLTDNWDAIQVKLGLGVFGGDDGRLSLEEAIELMHTYFIVLAGIGVLVAIVVVTSFIATMRMLGLRLIAICLLVTLGVLGAGEGAVSYMTLRPRPTNHVSSEQPPAAVSFLLIGCAVAQLVASVTGVFGFKWLHRECLFSALVVLLCAIAALAYVAAASYLWLRDTQPEHPEDLLLLFGIAAVSDLYMLFTIVFVGLLYCRHRRSFTEADQANEMREEYSDYASRERPNGGRQGKKKPKPREYLPSDRL